MLWCTPADAQVVAPGPPGPYVVDVRGATAGLPTDAPFYPPLGTTVAVSSRGFGFEAGAHVYLGPLGLPGVGIGASFVHLRGTSAESSATLRLVAPQVSVNFGTGNGWSYLSAGLGTGHLKTEIAAGPAARAASGTLRAVNFGGGARWFIRGHLGVGFDLRFHRLAAGEAREQAPGTPRVSVFVASVGVSIK